jgi:hypothetical protein
MIIANEMDIPIPQAPKLAILAVVTIGAIILFLIFRKRNSN